MQPTEINQPEVVAEVTAAFERYEDALVNNKVPILDELFWDSPHTVRFGMAENLYGHAMIREYRATCPDVRFRRDILKRLITTYGANFATADIEFIREGSARAGRQSQVWARMPDGWRVVSAHVSLMP